MLTGPQIRMALAALGWTLQELADRAGLSRPTVHRMSSSRGLPSSTVKNLQAVRETFEAAGIRFLDPDGEGEGVRFRDPPGERGGDAPTPLPPGRGRGPRP